MSTLLIESATIEFLYEFPGGKIPPGIAPWKIDHVAQKELLGLFPPSKFSLARSGTRVVRGTDETDAARNAIGFLESQLAQGMSDPKPVLAVPPSAGVYWRPIGPLHQVTGMIGKGSDDPAAWWTVELTLDPGKPAERTLAFLCYALIFRKLVG